MDFVVKVSDELTREGFASVPGYSMQDDRFSTGYILVQAGSNKSALQITARESASGDQIWVARQTLGLTDETVVSAQVTPLELNEFRWARLWYSGQGRWGLMGLLIGLVGLSIKVLLDVGDTGWALWSITGDEKGWLTWISSAAQIAGLIIVFIRGIWLTGK